MPNANPCLGYNLRRTQFDDLADALSNLTS